MRFWLVYLLSLSSVAHAGELIGKVVNVHDGDTLTVLVGSRQVRVRLAEIDAPERKQAFGTRSRQSLAELCAGAVARVIERGKDRYGRTLGTVHCASADVNAEQVRRGMAWVFGRFAAKDSPLHALQAEARASARGLWADPRPVEPWAWRRVQR
ncbi:MAG: thermonuclease family protein [Sulfuricaulis sp.]|uniref:thermonuclease family protein n=1 Tax=Sulfuricaulis sp. TaxID=2003553 RepID=UPI0034A3673C